MKSPLTDILSPTPAPTISLNSAELSTCVTLAQQHGLEMLLYSQLKKHYSGSNNYIDDYLSHNENRFLKNVNISMGQEAVEKDVVALLGKRGVPAGIIKGNEIARTLYGDPNCRSSSDIDILIKRADIASADSIFTGNGYRRTDSLPLLFWIGRLHHAQYQHSRHPFLIEVHWDFGVPFLFDINSDDIWNSVKRNNSGADVLSPEMTIMMLFIHHFRHGFREFKILVDIHWGLYKYDGIIDWQEFAGRLKKVGLIKSARIILAQLDSLWRLSDGPLKSFRILQEQLTHEPTPIAPFLLKFFRMDIGKDLKFSSAGDIIMARFVLDTWSKILYSFTKSFFPRPQEIKELYPASRNCMLPINYLRFISWRVKVWTGFAKQ